MKDKKNITYIIATLTSNNTIITISKNNQTLTTISCGKLGFKGAKRSTKYSNQILGEYTNDYIQNKKLKNIFLIFKGLTRNRRLLLRGLKKKKLHLIKLVDFTQIPHNGCRNKKKKRR